MTWQDWALAALVVDLVIRASYGAVVGYRAVVAAADDSHGPDRRAAQRR